MKKNKYKISSKYTLKRTKLHRFKKILGGACPQTPLAMRSMSLRDMQIPKSEKKILPPSLPKSWGRPCSNTFDESRNIFLIKLSAGNCTFIITYFNTIVNADNSIVV